MARGECLCTPPRPSQRGARYSFLSGSTFLFAPNARHIEGAYRVITRPARLHRGKPRARTSPARPGPVSRVSLPARTMTEPRPGFFQDAPENCRRDAPGPVLRTGKIERAEMHITPGISRAHIDERRIRDRGLFRTCRRIAGGTHPVLYRAVADRAGIRHGPQTSRGMLKVQQRRKPIQTRPVLKTIVNTIRREWRRILPECCHLVRC